MFVLRILVRQGKHYCLLIVAVFALNKRKACHFTHLSSTQALTCLQIVDC